VVYQQETCSEELTVEKKVRNRLTARQGDCDFVNIWGSTLHHVDDLPYNPQEYFPHVYGNFRKK